MYFTVPRKQMKYQEALQQKPLNYDFRIDVISVKSEWTYVVWDYDTIALTFFVFIHMTTVTFLVPCF